MSVHVSDSDQCQGLYVVRLNQAVEAKLFTLAKKRFGTRFALPCHRL